ncbi:ABCC3 [Cordylochernes scorpioides]|uniref:ABCC3 n=1 Tax=Cordylochernes scorpioides TaxID=51811 RepID=A0ABY6LFD5_9ARAC|nr:ABCC3 [Cordylochernes scorpioides]
MEALGDRISINQASFSLSEDIEATSALKNLTLNIPKRSLVGVIGRGDIAYASQEAWIQNATVKQNILFLKNCDSKLYRRVLENCSLKSDLIILPGGDMTEIGEKVAIWIFTILKSYYIVHLKYPFKEIIFSIGIEAKQPNTILDREETVLRRRKIRKESERSYMSSVNGRSSMALELEQVTRLIEEERLELGKGHKMLL